MVSSQPCVPLFSIRGLVDHMVELIVSKDKAFYLLDKPTFCWLIHYLHPSLSMKDIPHRTKIHEEVLVCAGQAKSKVKAMLQVRNTFSFCSRFCANYITRPLRGRSPSHSTPGHLMALGAIHLYQSWPTMSTALLTGQISGWWGKINSLLCCWKGTTPEQILWQLSQGS